MSQFVMYVFYAAGAVVILFIVAVVLSALVSLSTRTGSSDPNTLLIHPDGQEQFTPVLMAGRVYRISVMGTYYFESIGLFGSSSGSADGAYYTDSDKNFTRDYRGLCVSDTPIKTMDSSSGDRYLHQYSCLIEGAGQRLPLKLKHPKDSGKGSLTVAIELQPVGTLTDRLREAVAVADRFAQAQAAEMVREFHERQAKAVALAAEAQERERQRKAKEDEHQAQIMRQVADLSRMVYHERNFLDPQFRAEFTKKFQADMLTRFRPKWNAEYDAVLGDSDLAAALKTCAPDVLEWHERRHEMILEAEKATLMPPPLPKPSPRQITASTLPYVQQAISELFAFTELYDRTRQYLVQDHNQHQHRPVLERATSAMAFYYEELSRFGIVASTPEEAEIKFFGLCPPPAPTVYEELIGRLRSGERVPPEALCDRLEDLHREKIILQARRRASVRADEETQRNDIDRRLDVIRREGSDIRGFLESIKCPIEFKDPREREQEVGIEEQFMRLYAGKKRVIDFLLKEGDEETVEHVEALYAQEQAKLFAGGQESYT